MIIYLYGPDSYRRGKKLRELMSLYKQKNPSMDMRFFDFEENSDDWILVRDFLRQQSMFASKKCTVIKSATAVDTKEWIKTLKSYSGSKDTFILISEEKYPKKAFLFLTQKPIISQEFEKLEGMKLDMFLKKELKKHNLSFSPDAWKFFMHFVSESDATWLGIKTIEKAELAGFKQPISLGDIGLLISWFSRDKVYALTRQLVSQLDWKKKLGILEKAFFQKEDPAYIFNSLAYSARGKRLIELADYDISIKSGGLEYEEALLDFVLN